VSQPPPKKPRPLRRGSTHPAPEVLELVRIQHNVLYDYILEDNDDIESWSLAHVLRKRTNSITKEKTLILRFEDGHETDIFEGVVFRPSKVFRLHHRRPATVCPSGCAPSSSGELAAEQPPPTPSRAPLVYLQRE
jgi:hypothetical protein